MVHDLVEDDGTVEHSSRLKNFQDDANGSATITVTATDGGPLTASDTFTVNVNPVNDTPTVANALADVTVAEDAASTVIDLSTAPVFSDVDTGDTLTYTAVSSDDNLVTATISGSTLTLDYQPDANGSATITVVATDSGGLTVGDSFDVTVTAVNDGPTVENPLPDVDVDEDAPDMVIDLAGVFGDVDDALTYTAVSSDGTLVSTAISGSELTLDGPRLQ